MTAPRPRVGGLDAGPFAVLVVLGGPLLAMLITRTPWWAVLATASVLLATVTVPLRGRTSVRWLLAWGGYRLGRTARARKLLSDSVIRDIEVVAGVCGVQIGDAVLVAMIQLAPDLDLPTVIAEDTVYTEDTVPVEALLPLLEQYGITVDIDIVTTGQRVRSAGEYSMLYDQLIGSQPVVGDRLTWLVIRLDQQRNLLALSRRGPAAVSAPRALATAAHRIAGRLREQGIAAHALPAAAVREAMELLQTGIDTSELQESWRHLESAVPGRYVTSFLIDWTKVGTAGLDDCWSWNRGRTTVVVSLTADASGPRGIVRFVGPAVTDAPPDYLRPLPGRQSTALLATLPGPTSSRTLSQDDPARDIGPAEILAELVVPIGPNGQILGAISGKPQHTLALPLFDPAHYHPRQRSIDVRALLPVAQQIILRAMVVGAAVEVHSARPDRWRQLVAAVGDPASLRLAPGPGVPDNSGGGLATIAVFDQLPPQASGAQTTVTIGDPGNPRRRTADLAIHQVDSTTVDVSIPMRTVRVELIEPRGETRYFDSPAPDSAPVAEPVPPVSASQPMVGAGKEGM
ncbi:type VII secretion protein EccE [Nocardia sp. NBC_01388]|uniref:type VII secretion protein EccE n=1 Tax=Nocardia sp. NBC_01388 TaxID=2903596 RepID=UPI00324B25F8